MNFAVENTLFFFFTFFSFSAFLLAHWFVALGRFQLDLRVQLCRSCWKKEKCRRSGGTLAEGKMTDTGMCSHPVFLSCGQLSCLSFGSILMVLFKSNDNLS